MSQYNTEDDDSSLSSPRTTPRHNAPYLSIHTPTSSSNNLQQQSGEDTPILPIVTTMQKLRNRSPNGSPKHPDSHSAASHNTSSNFFRTAVRSSQHQIAALPIHSNYTKRFVVLLTLVGALLLYLLAAPAAEHYKYVTGLLPIHFSTELEATSPDMGMLPNNMTHIVEGIESFIATDSPMAEAISRHAHMDTTLIAGCRLPKFPKTDNRTTVERVTSMLQSPPSERDGVGPANVYLPFVVDAETDDIAVFTHALFSEWRQGIDNSTVDDKVMTELVSSLAPAAVNTTNSTVSQTPTKKPSETPFVDAVYNRTADDSQDVYRIFTTQHLTTWQIASPTHRIARYRYNARESKRVEWINNPCVGTYNMHRDQHISFRFAETLELLQLMVDTADQSPVPLPEYFDIIISLEYQWPIQERVLDITYSGGVTITDDNENEHQLPVPVLSLMTSPNHHDIPFVQLQPAYNAWGHDDVVLTDYFMSLTGAHHQDQCELAEKQLTYLRLLVAEYASLLVQPWSETGMKASSEVRRLNQEPKPCDLSTCYTVCCCHVCVSMIDNVPADNQKPFDRPLANLGEDAADVDAFLDRISAIRTSHWQMLGWRNFDPNLLTKTVEAAKNMNVTVTVKDDKASKSSADAALIADKDDPAALDMAIESTDGKQKTQQKRNNLHNLAAAISDEITGLVEGVDPQAAYPSGVSAVIAKSSKAAASIALTTIPIEPNMALHQAPPPLPDLPVIDRIAILYTGNVRSFASTFPWTKYHIIDRAPYPVDLFFHAWKDADTWTLEATLQAMNVTHMVKGILIEEQPAVPKNMLDAQSCFLEESQTPGVFQTQAESLRRSHRLKRLEEWRNGGKYKWVVRTRYDQQTRRNFWPMVTGVSSNLFGQLYPQWLPPFTTGVTFDSALPGDMNWDDATASVVPYNYVSEIYYPECGGFQGSYNDQFAVGTSDAMHMYCERPHYFQRCIGYGGIQSRGFLSENCYRKYAEALSSEYRLRVLWLPFCYSIVRPKGFIHTWNDGERGKKENKCSYVSWYGFPCCDMICNSYTDGQQCLPPTNADVTADAEQCLPEEPLEVCQTRRMITDACIPTE